MTKKALKFPLVEGDKVPPTKLKDFLEKSCDYRNQVKGVK